MTGEGQTGNIESIGDSGATGVGRLRSIESVGDLEMTGEEQTGSV